MYHALAQLWSGLGTRNSRGRRIAAPPTLLLAALGALIALVALSMTTPKPILPPPNDTAYYQRMLIDPCDAQAALASARIDPTQPKPVLPMPV